MTTGERRHLHERRISLRVHPTALRAAASVEDEAGNITTPDGGVSAAAAARRVIATTVRCPLCAGYSGRYGRGRPFRMHLLSPVHQLSDSPEDAEAVATAVRLAEEAADAEAAALLRDGPDAAEGPAGAAEDGAGEEEEGSEGLSAARAGQLERLRELVASGFDPRTATDRHGSTALHRAAGGGALAVVRYLVEECGVDVSQ